MVKDMLSDKQINSFQKLYAKHYSEEISREQVLEEGLKLIRFISLVHNIDLKKGAG